MAWVITQLETPPGDASSYAQCVNSDGNIIGGGSTDFVTEAKGVIWNSGTFTNVGSLADGDFVLVRGLSGNGAIAVGGIDGFDQTSEAFSYTSGGGLVQLPYLGSGQIAVAHGISNDGSVIVGQSSSTPGVGIFQPPPNAVSWTGGGSAVDLGLYSTNTEGIAYAASDDGSHIAGGDGLPWQWTSGGGLVGVPTPGGMQNGSVFSIDSSGTVVGGQYFGTPPLQGGFISQSGTGTDVTPSGHDVATILGLSGDGLTAVGSAQATIGSERVPFLWTLADGFTFLPLLAGHTQGQATAISSDGTTIVGRSGPSGSDSAVFWRLSGPTISATMAELWFGNTSTFVDLTDATNRRKFIAATGGAQNLGINGEAPFGVTPPVFLTSQAVPAGFAANNGRGGPFVVTGDALVHGDSDPPGTTSSVTTGGFLAPGNGVLGDYRNGNLYAFNTATYTDNGTRRKWVRRWRALPHSTTKAVRYSYLLVEMETGIDVPLTDNPQVVLRWSDDGGWSWSAERYVSVGRTGKTRKAIRFNRLGSTRRNAGSDRIFELSSTDAFRVSVIDADTETSP